jgi:hypothetical protein
MKYYLIYQNKLSHTSGFVLSPTKNLEIENRKRIHLFDSELSLQTLFYIPNIDEKLLGAMKQSRGD